MRHYSIKQTKGNPEVWDIMLFNNIVIRGVGNSDIANEVAEKLNNAYSDGVGEGKDIIKNRLDELLFS
jgi:hypothetical protein